MFSPIVVISFVQPCLMLEISLNSLQQPDFTINTPYIKVDGYALVCKVFFLFNGLEFQSFLSILTMMVIMTSRLECLFVGRNEVKHGGPQSMA